MLDQITDLAPRFRMPQLKGPVALNIIGSDVEGSGIIYQKALRNFPTDWQIKYRAAYYYLFETKDKQRAARLLISAFRDGGPGPVGAIRRTCDGSLRSRAWQLVGALACLSGLLVLSLYIVVAG